MRRNAKQDVHSTRANPPKPAPGVAECIKTGPKDRLGRLVPRLHHPSEAFGGRNPLRRGAVVRRLGLLLLALGVHMDVAPITAHAADWNPLASLAQARHGAASAQLAGRVYVLGGRG